MCHKLCFVRLFIIGYKSSGKTTLGKQLAMELNLEFIDLDDFIEQQEGKTIPEVFLEAGEEEFRRRERKALRRVIRKDDILVSTGGGVPCHLDNMTLMEKHGIIVYLKADDETLVSRLKTAAVNRPIVKGKSEEELRTYLAELRNRCERYYVRAHIIVDGNKTAIHDIMEQLKKVNAIQGHAVSGGKKARQGKNNL
ncbi:MAG: shikimate kinase [Bacteroidetes bacterium]|nr:shikimate kinase [Bacteroidota bacterium]